MDDWIAATVLPNIDLDEPIEGGLIALVPRHDNRVDALCKAYPNLKTFLGNFTDAFGVKLHPALLIIRNDAPKSVFTIDALASFRDAIAISAIVHNRALELLYPSMPRVTFSNALWFYPWMLDKDYKNIIAHTPAMLALHEVKKFRGQSTPELSQTPLRTSDLDKTLLTALCERWNRYYTARKPVWSDVALFRSLNMANQASQMPAGKDMTLYDVGRSIALWVSAFEILSHPGEGKTGLWNVYALLERVEYEYASLRYRRYKVYGHNKKNENRRIAACWLYGELHHARNDFLHGNPVTERRLTIKRSGLSLYLYAAPLYRLAMTGFLALSWSKPAPPMNDVQEFSKYFVERSTFLRWQVTIEKAILTAFGTEQTPP